MKTRPPWLVRVLCGATFLGGIYVQFCDAGHVEYIDSNFSYDGFLGVKLDCDKTEFYIWAPEADMVSLLIYKRQDDKTPYLKFKMTKGDRGVWQLIYQKSLDGYYYKYEYDYDGKINCGVDPYACAAGINGEKGYICRVSDINPKGWASVGYVSLDKYTDAVLYETHVRDFSIDPSSGIKSDYRGKFKAFTCANSVNPSGDSTCLAHIKELGITHVHLLPVFDYDRLDERNPFGSYNWGYDPENYNVPEGSYSTRPADPKSRILELKELVAALHANNIGVVMDVVYNHTYKLDSSNLSMSYPTYYYRYKDGKPSNGSGCGNEIASERAMVRKYIIDSVLFWASEYKIDGFRFDLMACLDIETMNEIEAKLKKINPSALIYGEGWTGGESALDPSMAALKSSGYKTPGIAYFNDTYRDAIKGSTFCDAALGYVSGNYHLRSSVTDGLLGRSGWANSLCSIINYCEAHDNLTLWDKLMVSAGGCNERDRKKMARLSGALVLLAQGVPFIHSGQEFLRSKALGGGKYDHNSYNSPDVVNSIKWNMLSVNKGESDYFRDLIRLRKAHPLLRMSSHEEVSEHSQVLQSSDGTIAIKLFGYDEELLILINPIPRAKMFVLPDGEWELILSDTMGSDKPMAIYCEGVFVPPISAMVLKKY